jgi:hypothetical protein
MIIQIGSHTVAIDPQYEAAIRAMYANINKDRRRIKREFRKAMRNV